MIQIAENIRQDLVKFVPSSLLNDISCFVFYDHHPRDDINMDVIICTSNREVKEFYKRDILSSLILNDATILTSINILRNSKNELFYIVTSENGKLFILNRKKSITCHLVLSDIERYSVEDTMCSGQASVKIFRNDDAVPVVLDDNLNIICDNTAPTIIQDDPFPQLIYLQRKLIEAKFIVKSNEDMLNTLKKLRQSASFYKYENQLKNDQDSLFHSTKQVSGALKVIGKPILKLCNKKMVLIIRTFNQSNILLEDINILIHKTEPNTSTYITKVYEKSLLPPFWKEKSVNFIEKQQEAIIACVFVPTELQSEIVSRIDINGVINYKEIDRYEMLPFEEISLSTVDVLSQSFNVLASPFIDEDSIVPILATSIQTNLKLRHIKIKVDEPNIDLLVFFHERLEMEYVQNNDCTLVQKSSPHHLLYGVVIVFHGEKDEWNGVWNISVYSSTSQKVLYLVHCLHDGLPNKVIATPSNCILTSKTEQLSHYDETIPDEIQNDVYNKLYAERLIEKSSLILKYLDKCLVKMNESKDPVVKSKIGNEIDLLVCGVEEFSEFKKKC